MTLRGENEGVGQGLKREVSFPRASDRRRFVREHKGRKERPDQARTATFADIELEPTRLTMNDRDIGAKD